MIAAKFMLCPEHTNFSKLFDAIQISQVGMKAILISHHSNEFSQLFISNVATCSP